MKDILRVITDRHWRLTMTPRKGVRMTSAVFTQAVRLDEGRETTVQRSRAMVTLLTNLLTNERGLITSLPKTTGRPEIPPPSNTSNLKQQSLPPYL